ncbi:Uncharacterized protein (Fragment) [Durusdinium trenchii]|uniref:Anaphase-promoting complex subunit 1 n=1 Tax=Durusdinium trenchii TaxID=1381693 RepID=A0ABP0HCB5_9DINO
MCCTGRPCLHRFFHWKMCSHAGAEAGRYRPVFLRVGQQTVRVPNFRSRDSAKCALCVPEARVFREIQSRRPQIIAAFQESPSESLTRVCSTGLRSEVSNVQWSHKGGGVFLAGDLQLSVQTGELLWREDGLKPLPDSMTRFEDFETIFGDASLQCGVVCRTQHRLWVHLVGRSFDLMEWSPSPLAAFKQGAGGPQEAPSSARCGRCGQSNGCWQCERCTMINCKLETSADSCVACGGPSPGGEESGPPLGPMGFGRGARRPKVQPVTEGVFLGERFSRPLDLYADEGPSLPDPESWLLDVLVPVLLELFPSDPEDRRLRYQLLLPEKVSSANDTEIRLLGFDHGVNPKEDQGVPLAQSKEEEQQAATWKEVLVSKTHEVVLVFNLVPHGRRFYRSLVFTSKSSLGLHNLPLDTPDAQKLPGAAGSFGEMRRQEGSLCIRRLNKELDKLGENYVSPRLLRGVVPSALLENYSFWEGEDGLLRGEPSDDQSTYFSKKLQIELQGGASPCTAVRFRITRLATAKFAPPTLPPEQREWRGLRPPELARGAVGSAARSAPVQARSAPWCRMETGNDGEEVKRVKEVILF